MLKRKIINKLNDWYNNPNKKALLQLSSVNSMLKNRTI